MVAFDYFEWSLERNSTPRGQAPVALMKAASPENLDRDFLRGLLRPPGDPGNVPNKMVPG